MRTFTLDAGRVIQIDGKPSIYIGLVQEPGSGIHAIPPAVADEIAHRITDLLNAHGFTSRWDQGITYGQAGTDGTLNVFTDGRIVGRIKRYKSAIRSGWVYWPKGSKQHSVVYATVGAVKAELERP